jgi:hypothetical protein
MKTLKSKLFPFFSLSLLTPHNKVTTILKHQSSIFSTTIKTDAPTGFFTPLPVPTPLTTSRHPQEGYSSFGRVSRAHIFV